LFRRYRYRKPLAAFGATAFEHVAPAWGRHPRQKAVRAFAPPIVGLISSFHLPRPISNPATPGEDFTCD
jgi:hypothetical protein